MVLSLLALCVMLVGSSLRWSAYRGRVAPPRRFRPLQLGFWFPPLPEQQEFAQPADRRREIAGRVVVYVALVMILARSIFRYT